MACWLSPTLPDRAPRCLRSRSATVPLVVLLSQGGRGRPGRRRRPPVILPPKVFISWFFGLISPPPHIPRSRYRCTCPTTLPMNRRVVLRLPNVLIRRLTRTVTAGLPVSSRLLCRFPPPLPTSSTPPPVRSIADYILA